MGERIKEARTDASLSIAKIARELDVDARTVARWQANDAMPSVIRLAQLAEVLGKPISYFLEEAADAA